MKKKFYKRIAVILAICAALSLICTGCQGMGNQTDVVIVDPVLCVCEGTGICNSCKGDGIAVRKRQEVLCDHCLGDGVCIFCGGTGWEEREAQEKRAKEILSEFDIDYYPTPQPSVDSNGGKKTHSHEDVGRTCPSCKGLKTCAMCYNGKVSCAQGVAAGTCYNGTCGLCMGKGFYNNRKCTLCDYGRHKACNGTGRKTCNACGGSGTCSICHGTGEV